MALRVMQIFLPQASDQSLNELLEGRQILGRWRDTDPDQIVLHLLVPAEETEPIMDRFEQRFASVEGFHVVLFPVEAVLPLVQGRQTCRAGVSMDDSDPHPPYTGKQSGKGLVVRRVHRHRCVPSGVSVQRAAMLPGGVGRKHSAEAN